MTVGNSEMPSDEILSEIRCVRRRPVSELGSSALSGDFYKKAETSAWRSAMKSARAKAALLFVSDERSRTCLRFNARPLLKQPQRRNSNKHDIGIIWIGISSRCGRFILFRAARLITAFARTLGKFVCFSCILESGLAASVHQRYFAHGRSRAVFSG